jgi:hypothetical protein
MQPPVTRAQAAKNRQAAKQRRHLRRHFRLMDSLVPKQMRPLSEMMNITITCSYLPKDADGEDL